jgi:hypothetical protein
LLLRYKDGQFLIKDWTTKKCIEELDGKADDQRINERIEKFNKMGVWN